MPAAASRWPMLVFTEPIQHGWSAGRPAESTAPSALASIGSPTGVPVPCASTYWIEAGSTPARRQASRTRASWAAPLGTVSPGVRPS